MADSYFDPIKNERVVRSEPGPERAYNVYDGKPDDRQSADPAHKPSRFRPTYRPLTQAEKDLHDRIKGVAGALELLFDEVPDGRYKALAMTALEESVMWSVKGLTQ